MWLIRRVHTYAGLLTFVNLVVYGFVGLSSVYLLSPSAGQSVVSERNFKVEPNLTDLQVAERVCSELNLTLATPVHSYVIGHDGANHLVLDFRHANGKHLVTVLENEGRLRIEVTRNTLPLYLFTLHETTAAFHSGDRRMQFWADYNEFAMWCMVAMIVSGFLMFLAVRLRSRLAQISLAAGGCACAALYFYTR